MSTEQQVREFGRVWAAAEERGDTEVLAGLAADGFRLVGPLGFVLDRDQWLARHGDGGLVTEKLDWAGVEVRDFGGTVIAIGVQEQVATYRGNPANGRFRATHVLVRAGDRWRLASMHLSPIGGPPPFAHGVAGDER
jgi:ketosteroid isomerase-like protein